VETQLDYLAARLTHDRGLRLSDSDRALCSTQRALQPPHKVELFAVSNAFLFCLFSWFCLFFADRECTQSMSRLPVEAQSARPPKWLANVTRSQLFFQYEHWHLTHLEGAAASMSTFRRVWVERWRGIIRIRHQGQHSKCTECCRLARRRQLADTAAELQDIAVDHQQHLSVIFADRSTDDRANVLSAQSCAPRFALELSITGPASNCQGRALGEQQNNGLETIANVFRFVRLCTPDCQIT